MVTMHDRFIILAIAASVAGVIGCDIDVSRGKGLFLLLLFLINIISIYLLYKNIKYDTEKVYLEKNLTHENSVHHEPVCLAPICNSSNYCKLHITNQDIIHTYDGFIVPLMDLEISNHKKCKYYKHINTSY